MLWIGLSISSKSCLYPLINFSMKYLVLCKIYTDKGGIKRACQTLSSRFPTKRDSNQSPQLQRLAKRNEKSLVASLDMILFIKRITKALIRLCGCAGWSVPLLFSNRFSRVEAHIVIPWFVLKILHSLKLVDYPRVKADRTWQNYYITERTTYTHTN